MSKRINLSSSWAKCSTYMRKNTTKKKKLHFYISLFTGLSYRKIWCILKTNVLENRLINSSWWYHLKNVIIILVSICFSNTDLFIDLRCKRSLFRFPVNIFAERHLWRSVKFPQHQWHNSLPPREGQKFAAYFALIKLTILPFLSKKLNLEIL